LADVAGVEVEDEEVVDGLKLRRSAKNASGYYGVYPTGSIFKAQINVRGRTTHVGTFPTARDAAVAVAKHTRLHDHSKAGRNQPLGFALTATRSQSRSTSGAYMLRQLGTTTNKSAAAPAPGSSSAAEKLPRQESSAQQSEKKRKGREDDLEEVVDGLKLRRSAKNASGYYGVYPRGSMFKAQINIQGRETQIGTFPTARDAAVAVAKQKHAQSAVQPARLSTPAPPPLATPPPAPTTQFASGMAAVHDVLVKLRLEQYAKALDDLGYDDLEFMLGVSSDSRREIAEAVGMKPGHAAKFADWLIRTAAGS
jgi:hypothetical protein